MKPLNDPLAQQAVGQFSAFFDALQSIPQEQQIQLLTGYQQAMRIALHTQLRMLGEVSNAGSVLKAIPEGCDRASSAVRGTGACGSSRSHRSGKRNRWPNS